MPHSELRSLYPFHVTPVLTIRAKRWRVERAGYAGHYESGWFALDPATDQGALFPTMQEAVDFAVEMAARHAREVDRRFNERKRNARNTQP